MSRSSPLPSGSIAVAAGETIPVSERREIREMQETLYSYTVPIVEDCTVADEKTIRIGTGVVIEIGSRTFVASAGHVLDKHPHVLFGRNPQFEHPCPPPTYLRREFMDRPDIGFLEVGKDSNYSACMFESLTDAVPPSNTPLMLVGHPVHAPGSLFDPNRRAGSPRELIRTAHTGGLIEATEDRYVLGYPEDVLDVDSDTGELTAGKSHPTPGGFSGGGLWAKRALSTIDGLVHPGNRYRLFALDYSWSETRRRANFVPIRFWVRLVCNHYPDLRELILTRFPNLEQVRLPE